MKLARLLSAATLLAAPLPAGDYDALGKAIRSAWPQVATVGVICDATGSKAALEALGSAMSGMKLVVVDAKGPQDMGKALGTLSSRRPDAVVLIASDRVVGDGSSAATFLIQRMAASKVPVAATTEQGLRQGAVMAVGPGTGGKLLANPKAAGACGIPVPAGATSI